jgi:hypothetical protein
VRRNLNGSKTRIICSIILGWTAGFAAVQPGVAEDLVSRHMTVVVHPDLHTGKLVQSVVVQAKEVEARVHPPLKEAPPNQPVTLSSNIVELVGQIARIYGVEVSLVHSVIRAESNYNAQAVSHAGALGMMQLIPATARRFGVSNPFDPKQNIEGGVRYLRFLLDYYKNDYLKAIAAYNAGEGAVDRYQGIPPYAETRAYVYQVAKNLKAARLAEETRSKAPQMASNQEAGGTGSNQKAETTDQQLYHPIRASVTEDGRVYYRTQ